MSVSRAGADVRQAAKVEGVKATQRQSRDFRAVVERGTFSRAAESVCISRPSLSPQIQELEGRLRCLLERDGRRIALTQLGREVRQQALRLLDEALLLETIGKRHDARADAA